MVQVNSILEVINFNLTPTKLSLEDGQGCISPETASVTSISGWLTSSGSNAVTIAYVKLTPVQGYYNL